jgi:hypothetical protein
MFSVVDFFVRQILEIVGFQIENKKFFFPYRQFEVSLTTR